MVARVSVRDVKCVPAYAGSTIWDVESSQILSLREAGLGAFTGVRSRRKVCPRLGRKHNSARRQASDSVSMGGGARMVHGCLPRGSVLSGCMGIRSQRKTARFCELDIAESRYTCWVPHSE